MAELEIYGRRQPENDRKYRPKFTRTELMLGVIGFFLAMAVPYSGMTPFGLSFLAQERRFSVRTLLYFAAVSLGAVVACDRPDVTKYIVSGIIYLAVLFVLEWDVELSALTASLIMGVSLFFTGLIMLYWTGFSVSDAFLLLCEGAAVSGGAFVLDKSNRLVREGRVVSDKLSLNEKISLALVVALVVLSLKGFEISAEFSVMDMVAAVLILEVASGCGIAFSTGAGVVLGFICGIDSNFFLSALGSFGFCGFAAGAFSKYGKSGIIGGAILADLVLMLYTNGAVRATISLYEVMAAAVVFALLPGKWSYALRKIACTTNSEREAVARIKDNLRIKLRSVADSFEGMAETLNRISDKGEEGNADDIAVVFDYAADRVCKSCCKAGVCWDKEFGFAYDALSKVMNVMNEKGQVCEEDVEGKFAANCLNLSKLIAELNHRFDMYRAVCVWKSKLRESRELVEEQLRGMSEIIVSLSEDVAAESDTNFSVREISEKLEKRGVKTKFVDIVRESNGRYRVCLTLNSGYWKDKIRGEIMNVMRETYGCEVNVRDMLINNGKHVKVEFSEPEKYCVETDFARKAASEENGDNYRFTHISEGKYVIALSDGMGTGTRAARESEAMLELLDSCLRAGFDSKMAVKFINSIMLLKSEEEAFVTIDICIIDLYTGRAEFVKTGAEPSFIMYKNYVDTVKAASLPAGIFANLEAETTLRKIGDGSVIVMVTDGVETRESGSLLWVKDFIEEACVNKRGERLAERILESAIEKNNGEVNDDITVLSVKLREVG